MSKFEAFILTLIIVLAFGVRVYKINNPIADWHSFRQADTSAVTRNFVKNGIDVLHPKYDDLSNIQSGKDNPEGYRMVEFPIYNLVHYGIFQFSKILSPTLPLETAGRLTTVFVSLFSLLFLYGIVRSLSGMLLAQISVLIFAILPYSIYYSRVILPGPTMVMFALGAVWFFIQSLQKQKSQQVTYYLLLIVSALFGAISLLIKPTAIFILPLTCFLAFKKWKFQVFKIKFLYLYWLIILLPIVLWRQWIQQFPEGIPAYGWLFFEKIIPFQPAWWRWLFYERIGNLILGGWGLVLFVLGIVSRMKKNIDWFYLFWLFLGILYLIVLASGNVQHDYYQILLIPIISILVAKGIIVLWSNKGFNKWISIPVSIFCFFFFLFLSWYQIKGYYQINNPAIVEAGKAVDELLPENAKVIAPYFGDTAFLYQTNRKGWPLVTYYPIEKMIDLGATHYVSVTYDDYTKKLMEQFPVLEENEKFVIIKLKI